VSHVKAFMIWITLFKMLESNSVEGGSYYLFVKCV